MSECSKKIKVPIKTLNGVKVVEVEIDSDGTVQDLAEAVAENTTIKNEGYKGFRLACYNTDSTDGYAYGGLALNCSLKFKEWVQKSNIGGCKNFEVYISFVSECDDDYGYFSWDGKLIMENELDNNLYEKYKEYEEYQGNEQSKSLYGNLDGKRSSWPMLRIIIGVVDLLLLAATITTLIIFLTNLNVPIVALIALPVLLVVGTILFFAWNKILPKAWPEKMHFVIDFVLTKIQGILSKILQLQGWLEKMNLKTIPYGKSDLKKEFGNVEKENPNYGSERVYITYAQQENLNE